MNETYDPSDDNTPDASELLDFELIAKSQPDKGRGVWLWVVLILILAGGGGAGWMYLQAQDAEMAKANAGGVPLILEPQFKLKEKPADPGGMRVPDRDKSVYDRMNGTTETTVVGGVERLLPPSELVPPVQIPVPAPVVAPAPVPQPLTPTPPAAVASPPPPPPVAKVVEAAPAPKPAPVAKPASNPAPKPTSFGTVKSTAPAGLGYMIQISAVRTEEAAKGEWARLAKKHPDVLGGLESVVQRADLGTKGIFYRVRGGWLATRGEASAVCAELVRRNVGCILVKP